MPLAVLPDTYHHFVTVMTAVSGPSSTPETVPGLSFAASVSHALVKTHPPWWLNALAVRKVIVARQAVRQVWEVVGLEQSLEVVSLARPRQVTCLENSVWSKFTSANKQKHMHTENDK